MFPVNSVISFRILLSLRSVAPTFVFFIFHFVSLLRFRVLVNCRHCPVLSLFSSIAVPFGRCAVCNCDHCGITTTTTFIPMYRIWVYSALNGSVFRFSLCSIDCIESVNFSPRTSPYEHIWLIELLFFAPSSSTPSTAPSYALINASLSRRNVN